MSLAEIIKQKQGCPLCGNGLTIRQLAKKIGVNSTTLWRVKAGKTPDEHTLLAICRWAKIDPRKLDY